MLMFDKSWQSLCLANHIWKQNKINCLPTSNYFSSPTMLISATPATPQMYRNPMTADTLPETNLLMEHPIPKFWGPTLTSLRLSDTQCLWIFHIFWAMCTASGSESPMYPSVGLPEIFHTNLGKHGKTMLITISISKQQKTHEQGWFLTFPIMSTMLSTYQPHIGRPNIHLLYLHWPILTPHLTPENLAGQTLAFYIFIDPSLDARKLENILAIKALSENMFEFIVL